MLRRCFEGIVDATPAQCAVCRAWPARPLCAACRGRFGAPRPRCRRCATALPEGVAECGHCLREPPATDACHAAVSYGYPWSDLIGRFKFMGQPGWAATFVELLRRQPAISDDLAAARWVVPMPMAPLRLRERGFNQAWELARRLAPRTADARLVLRLRETAPQARLDRAARLRNLHGAFAVEPGRASDVRGERIVVVDDVMTSGASLFAVAAVLKAAGAAHVSAIVVARAEETGH
jgi:ComF family protein